MTLTKCLTKSNMAIKITPTKQLKSASPTKMKRYQLIVMVIVFGKTSSVPSLLAFLC